MWEGHSSFTHAEMPCFAPLPPLPRVIPSHQAALIDSGAVSWLQQRTCMREGWGLQGTIALTPAPLLPPVPPQAPQINSGREGGAEHPRSSAVERGYCGNAEQGPAPTAPGPCPVLHRTAGRGARAGAGYPALCISSGMMCAGMMEELTKQKDERADTAAPRTLLTPPAGAGAGASGCEALPAAQGQSLAAQSVCPILRQQRRQRCLACRCRSPAPGSRACRAVPASLPAPQPREPGPQPQHRCPLASSLAAATTPLPPSRTPTPASERELPPPTRRAHTALGLLHPKQRFAHPKSLCLLTFPDPSPPGAPALLPAHLVLEHRHTTTSLPVPRSPAAPGQGTATARPRTFSGH